MLVKTEYKHMHHALMRIAIAREEISEDLTPITPSEELMLAPPDEVMAEPEIAEAITADETEGEQLIEGINTLTDAGVEAEEVVSQLKEAGPDITDTTVLIAQERLSNIFGRVDLKVRRVSRESMAVAQPDPTVKTVAEDDRAGPYSAAQDLIKDAEKNLEFIKVAANEGIKEFVNRIAVNTKNLFRWASTYAKEARNVAAAAAKTQGTPTDAVYNNRLRIAYFTDANKQQITDGAAVKQAVGNMSKNVRSLNELSVELASVFKFFAKGSGRLDLPNMFSDFDKTKTADGSEALSLTGTTAFFGEELVLSGARVEAPVNNQKEMMEALSRARVEQVWHWKVKELDGKINLPVMSAGDVERSARQLEDVAKELVADYRIVGAMINRVQHDEGTIHGAIIDLATDTISNPGMIKFRGKIRRLISQIAVGCDQTINIKAKTLNCLMDYYKWSLKNHKAAGN